MPDGNDALQSSGSWPVGNTVPASVMLNAAGSRVAFTWWQVMQVPPGCIAGSPRSPRVHVEPEVHVAAALSGSVPASVSDDVAASVSDVVPESVSDAAPASSFDDVAPESHAESPAPSANTAAITIHFDFKLTRSSFGPPDNKASFLRQRVSSHL